MAAAKKKTAGKKTAAAKVGPVCAVDGCDRPVLVRGLCEDHWEDGLPVS